jgi:hypothetical protein
MLLAPLTEHNPVLRAERQHQWHVMENSRARTVWIWLAALMLVPALLISLLLFLAALVSPWLPEALNLFDVRYVLAQLAFVDIVTMNVAMYTVVTLITLGMASDSIAREKKGNTWESLLLTSISARQIVWGKWWATLQALGGDHVLIVALRLGLLAIVVVGLHVSTILPSLLPGLPVIAPHVLVLSLLLLAFTALEAGLTAALGVLSSLLPTDGAASLVVVFGGRVLLTAGLLVFPALAFLRGWGRYYLALGLVGLVVYGALMVGCLLLAQVLAVREHAASPYPDTGITTTGAR